MNKETTATMKRTVPGAVTALLLAVTGAVGFAPAAKADLGFESAGASVQTPNDANGVGSTFWRQAGAHPDFVTKIRFPMVLRPNAGGLAPEPAEVVRDVDVDLPVGFTGNPTATPTCTLQELSNPGEAQSICPRESQVGQVFVQQGPDGSGANIGLFNMEHAADEPGLLGMNYNTVVALIKPRVRPGDYGISSGSFSISQTLPIYALTVTVWGVPADTIHDGTRETGGSSASRPRPFFTIQTSCSDSPSLFSIRVDSWENPGSFTTASLTSDMDDVPFVIEGCENLPFDPSITAQPVSTVAGSPSGLNVDLKVPQNEAPNGLATAHVRKVTVKLPDGMVVSPSSANGLEACSPAQIGLGSNADPACPDASKVGTVSIDTPLLDDPVEGDVIVAKPHDNPFDSLLALYVVAKGPGFWLKLPGKVEADPVTGQLTTTFDDNPQLPFDRLRMAMRAGPQAPLVTPGCGTHSTTAQMVSWATDDVVSLTTPMTIDQGCAPHGFAPAWSAGVRSPSAGRTSAFALRFSRDDSSQTFKSVDVELPDGLLGKVGSVPLCPEAQAAAGTCSAASKVGETKTSAGAGSMPVWIPQAGKAPTAVHLAGPYRGAPYSLSFVVPAQAGPYDLGTVVARVALFVDPTDAHLTARLMESRIYDTGGSLSKVVEGGLPTILEGIPLNLREVRVDVDRPDFTVNPTNCDPMTVDGKLTSAEGTVKNVSSRFQVGDCSALRLTPKLGMRLTGAKQTRRGGHPALRAKLTQPKGQANLDRVQVKLPPSLALDPNNASDPKLLCGYEEGLAATCPASSIIGNATAVSPLLKRPLRGPVYFVQGVRFDKRTGNRIRTLPTLLVKLDGEVQLNVRAKSSVQGKRLVTTFSKIPDAAVSSFALNLKGGETKGILTVTGRPNLCHGSQRGALTFDGHNGKRRSADIRIKTPCRAKAAARRR